MFVYYILMWIYYKCINTFNLFMIICYLSEAFYFFFFVHLILTSHAIGIICILLICLILFFSKYIIKKVSIFILNFILTDFLSSFPNKSVFILILNDRIICHFNFIVFLSGNLIKIDHRSLHLNKQTYCLYTLLSPVFPHTSGVRGTDNNLLVYSVWFACIH